MEITHTGNSIRLLKKINTFDILKDISIRLGHRLKLGSLAECTLGVPKSADGIQSLQWFKEGKIEDIIKYCKQDVAITRDIFLYGLSHSYLIYDKKGIGKVRLPVDWKLEKILKLK